MKDNCLICVAIVVFVYHLYMALHHAILILTYIIKV